MLQHASLLPLFFLLSNVGSGHGFCSHSHSLVSVRDSSSLAGKRADLGASTRKTDSRSVLEWLGLSPREVERLRKPLGVSSSALLEERLALRADGQTDSVAVREKTSRRLSFASDGCTSSRPV